MIKSKLAFGPMSSEVIESIFRYSHTHSVQLMIICSRNQIDYNGGYVSTTSDFMTYVKQLRLLYPRSDVVICRDHCGPGFGNNDGTMDSVKQTILHDVTLGFDLIHIDLCYMKGSYKDKVKHMSDLISFGKNLNDSILFEIGTDENTGDVDQDPNQISYVIDGISELCSPEFYVIRTGSLVTELRNSDCFREDHVSPLSELIHDKNIKVKEHNADYLTSIEIARRSNIIDAVNIAPQLGTVQTRHMLLMASVYGIKCDKFQNLVYQSKKWQKWICDGNECNVNLCVSLSGHYHYTSEEYSDIFKQLSDHIDMRDRTICFLMDIMSHYDRYMI